MAAHLRLGQFEAATAYEAVNHSHLFHMNVVMSFVVFLFLAPNGVSKRHQVVRRFVLFALPVRISYAIGTTP